MQKIPTIFERDWDGDRSRVLDKPHKDCGWVFAGEGVATRKYDGTCVMFDGDVWWARREVKEGKEKPVGFVLSAHNDETGKTVGWEPIEQGPFAKFHAEAVAAGGFVGDHPEGHFLTDWPIGTYELCGPKVQKNPEGYPGHTLVFHGGAEHTEVSSRAFESIRTVLEQLGWEGIVFHHPDGRMAKVKKRDFGLKR